MRSRRIAALASALCVSLAALAGCGGSDSDPGDQPDPSAEAEAAIAQVSEGFFVELDPRALCENLVTDRFIDEAYGGKSSTCLSAQREAVAKAKQSGGPPDVEIGRIEISGEQASAEYRVSEDITGTLDLVLDDAGQWRVEGYDADAIRETLYAGFEGASETGGIATFPPVERCLEDTVEKLPDATLRRRTYAVDFGGADVEGLVLDLLSKCPDEVNAYVSTQVLKAYDMQGTTPAQLRCAKQRLPFILDVTGIDQQTIRSFLGGDVARDTSYTVLAGIVSGVQKVCG